MITASFLSGLGAGSLGTLFVRLAADSSSLVGGLRDAELAMVSSTDAMLRSAKLLSVGVTGALVTVGAAAVNEFAKFNKAMTESTAIMGDLSAKTKKRMEELALSLSGEGIKSSTELAKSYYYLASAGLNVEQSMVALPIAMRFATAGNFEMEKGTMLLTSAQSALGLKVNDTTQYMKNMARVADVLVKADILAQGTTEQFAEALSNKAAAALRLANKDIEEGVAVLAAFADQGLRGEAAGDALNIVLRDLQRTAITNQLAFKELGITVYNAQGNMRNMADIMKDFERVLGDASVEERRMAFQMLGFHDRSLSALLALVGFSDKIRDYEKALREAGGTTEDVTKRQLEAFSNQWAITGNQIKNFLILLGESLAPALSEFNNQLREVIKWLSETQKETGALTAVFMTIFDILKYFTLGLAIVWTSLRSLSSILQVEVNKEMSLFQIAILANIKLNSVWWTTIKGIVSGLFELAKAAAGAADVLKALLERDFEKAAGAYIKMAFEQGTAIVGITRSIRDGVLDAIKIVEDGGKKSVAVFTDTFAKGSKEVVKDLMNQWSGLIAFAIKLFPSLDPGLQMMKKGLDSAAKSSDDLARGLTKVTDEAKRGGEEIQKMANSLKVSKLIDLFGTTPRSQLFTKEESKRMQGVSANQLMGSMKLGQMGELGTAKTEEMLKASGLVGAGAGGVSRDLFSDQLVGQESAIKREIEMNQNKLRILEEINKKDIKLNEETQKLKADAIEKYNQRLKQLQTAQALIVVQAGQNMFDALGKAVAGFAGEQSKAYMAMFAASKAFAIAESIIKIQQGIAEAISLPWPANLVAVASVVAAAANIVSSIQAINLQISGNKAMGGPVSQGDSYIVGERGPEVFTPSQSGTIIPNNRLGGSTRVVINNYTDARPEVRERTEGEERVIDVMIRRVKSELSSEIQDGRGDVTRSMESSWGLRRGR